jgi:calcium/proton exchanger cax
LVDAARGHLPRLAAVAVGVMSEILVGSISEAAADIGLSEFFVGVIVVAIVGNAAEHWVAVLVAAKDKMDLAVNIAIGSSAQIALFVAPSWCSRLSSWAPTRWRSCSTAMSWAGCCSRC